MFRSIFLVLLISTVTTISFAKEKNSNPIIDSSRITYNEIGLSAGGFHYNSFAPDHYLQGFGMDFSKGLFYKREFKNYSIRLGLVNSTKQIIHTENNLKNYTCNADTFNISGKSEGSIFSAGIEKNLVVKGALRFYAGVDLAMADKTFHGDYMNFSGTTSLKNKKEMLGFGVNPLVGLSVTLFTNFRISGEANFANWFIIEKNTQNYILPEPETKIINTNRFVSSPNPLNSVSISVLF